MTISNAPRVNRETWFQRIEQWHSSGLTQEDYCRQHNLNPSSFYNWLSKHRQAHNKTSLSNHRNGNESKLIPVSTESIAPELTLTVGEISVSFSSQLPPAVLIPWINALRAFVGDSPEGVPSCIQGKIRLSIYRW